MTDLRKAAEDLLEVVEAAIKAGDWKVDGACDLDLAIVRLRQALAQPERGNSNSNYPNTKANTSLKHEPWCDSVTKLLLSFPPQIPPCNCKPKREWVGLTDEDKDELLNLDNWTDIVEAVEAKLKEKNGG